jgi:hypothetical protein
MTGIGIEKDPAYVELCRKRLADAVNAHGAEAAGAPVGGRGPQASGPRPATQGSAAGSSDTS